MKSPNGTLLSSIMNLNLEKGKVGAWFIIPADLKPGDCFFDEAINNEVEIEGEEKIKYAGASRTITNATTSERLKRWDKTTGIFVECVDIFDDYSINATAIKTNLWDNQTLESDQTTFQTLAITGFVITIAVGTVMYGVRKRNRNHQIRRKKNPKIR